MYVGFATSLSAWIQQAFGSEVAKLLPRAYRKTLEYTRPFYKVSAELAESTVKFERFVNSPFNLGQHKLEILKEFSL